MVAPEKLGHFEELMVSKNIVYEPLIESVEGLLETEISNKTRVSIF